MAFKLANKEKKAKNASPKNSADSSKKNSQADDVLAFLEQQKKDAKAKEEAGQCMFCQNLLAPTLKGHACCNRSQR